MKALTTITTLTPTRMGMGQSVGLIDLPVHREASTNWPLLSGSGIKGVLLDADKRRTTPKEDWEAKRDRIYGSAGTSDGQGGAGSLIVTDLFPLLFPVRSSYGVYAWVTCPMALARVKELADLAGVPFPANTWNPAFPEQAAPDAIHHENAVIAHQNIVALDEFDLKANQKDLSDLANALNMITGRDVGQFKARLAIVHDDLFTFLTEQGTEVRTKTALEFKVKKVKQSSLRQEEYLPVYSIFVGYAEVPDENYFPNETLQIGAEASTGAGLVKWKVTGGTA